MIADRNLLLGILALQLDFIDRDQLIAAMNAWVLDKSRPLEALLVDECHLSAARCELLSALLEEHLKQHDDDPEQSLRRLLPLSADLDALATRITDDEVQATIGLVAADRRVAADVEATAEFTLGQSSSAGTRFRVLRPHAQGGLGQVSVALDEELGREVALKEIQQRYSASEANRNRFVLEAEITGGLEHPGIVPVYGLGQYADGRPFYAMRFIRGNSLKQAVERFHDPQRKQQQDPTARRLELRSLLGRLIDVCNAMEYAHSRGVLHRDLKPSNVMLGKFGETLVVDWGLAKVIGRDEVQAGKSDESTLQPGSSSGSTPTQMGSAIGTPAYMSPEQAAGRLDQLGPACDVYSLGATLYAVLTGAAPFDFVAEKGDLLQQVQEGNFPRPRQRDLSVPAALEAICLKALATDPAARYASPSRLAEDLDHWLADEPVAAYRESFSQRMGRWERRHRSYVRAGGAALFLVAAVAVAAAVSINGARHEETRQRVRADQNAASERRAAEEARAAEREARANLARAVAAEAETVEALSQAKAEAVASAEVSDFLVNLFLGSDPTGLGGGLAAIDERGKDMSAVALLEYGAKSLQQEINAKPEVRARLLDTLGFIFTTYAEYEKAMPLLTESLQLRRQLYGDGHPELVSSLKHAGVFYYLIGNYRKARQYEREALAICERHFGPDSGLTAEMLFLVGWHISGGYTNATLLEESEQLLRRAIRIQEGLYGPRDQRPVFARLALAHTLVKQERTAEGMVEVMGAIRKLAASQGDSRPAEIISNLVRGMAAERLENWDEASARMHRALELAKGLLGERHSFVPYFQGPIVNYLERAGDDEAAEEYLRKLVGSEREILTDSPWVAFRLEELAAFLVRHERYQEAAVHYEESLRIRRAALGEDSLFVGWTLDKLADVARRQDDLVRAERLLREALAVYDTATEDHPDTVSAWRAEAAERLFAITSELENARAGE